MFSVGTSEMDIKKRDDLSGSCKALAVNFFSYKFRHLVIALRVELLQGVVDWN